MGMVPTQLTGTLKKDPVDERDYKFSAIPDSQRIVKLSSPLPEEINWRSEMSSPKYQGNLGSCVAFSVCALKEWQEREELEKEIADKKTSKKDLSDYNFSEQWVYWNAKKIDPWPNEEGTNYRSALKVIQKIGVPLESAWPYTDDPINIGKPKQWANLIARWAMIGSYWRVDNHLDDLKMALADSPVLIGIPCFDEIYGKLVNGHVPYPKKPKEIYAYHAVLATGYNNKDSLVYFKNSWSKFWGDEGFGSVTYRFIDDFLGDAWVVKDIAVTTEMLKGAKTLIG